MSNTEKIKFNYSFKTGRADKKVESGEFVEVEKEYDEETKFWKLKNRNSINPLEEYGKEETIYCEIPGTFGEVKRINNPNGSIKIRNEPPKKSVTIRRKNLNTLSISLPDTNKHNYFNMGYVNKYGMCNLMNLEYLLKANDKLYSPQSGGEWYEKSFNRPFGKAKLKVGRHSTESKYIQNHFKQNEKFDTFNEGYFYCGNFVKDRRNYHMFLSAYAYDYVEKDFVRFKKTIYNKVRDYKKDSEYFKLSELILMEDSIYHERFEQLINGFLVWRSNTESLFYNYIVILTGYTIILYISNLFPDNRKVKKYKDIKSPSNLCFYRQGL